MPVVHIDAATDRGPQPHFWRSMGFTPASLLLEPEMRQTVIYNGAVPHHGVRYARIHFLLDLVEVRDLGTAEPCYDWSRLDRAIDHLLANGLLPFFELMGDPSRWFDDLSQAVQLHAWKNLVRDYAQHAIERYGLDCVRSWYFETWNEPDLPWWKHSVEAFLHYYDACSEGLREADAELRFGGPGTCETLHPFFTELMTHCVEGTNYFTGEQGVRIDFISFHEKGGKWSNEAVSPSVDLVIDSTRKIIDWLQERYPQLLAKPLINDECDPLIGWKQFHTWRALPYYAATVCRLIDRHQRDLGDALGVDFAFLSSDNGFIGQWGQRSQLACFCPDKERGQGRFELIKKPVFNVMTALSLLGDRRLPVAIDGPDWLGCLATRRGEQIVVLIYGHDDRQRLSDRTTIAIRVAGCPAGEYRLAHWCIAEEQGHPFATWEAGNYPDFPDKDPAKALWPDTPDPGVFAKLRAVQELRQASAPRDCATTDGVVELDCAIELHSVHVLVLDSDPGQAPAVPAAPSASRWQGRVDREQVLLRWADLDDYHLAGYEVAHRPTDEADWLLLTETPLLDCAFLHPQGRTPATGSYRVRAVDYWGRTSDWSPSLDLPPVLGA